MRIVDSIAFDADGNVKLVNMWGRCIIEEKNIIVQREKQYVLLQFTGLKDKKGNEIYEGDTVRFFDDDKSLGNVVFMQGKFLVEKIGYIGLLENLDLLEVIGNIYEGVK